jgi:hypothetical protein
MPEADCRLRESAQLRKLWRAFREPQENLKDERLYHLINRDRDHVPRLQGSIGAYDPSAIQAAIRRLWCPSGYATIA